MAAVSGQLTTFNMPNYLGELYHLTPSETPFLSLIGSLNGGKPILDTQWSWQTEDNAAASQDTKLEGADATFSGRDRAPVSNCVQIHQEGVEVTYTKQAALNMLANAAKTGTSTSAILSIQGIQPVRNEMAHQLTLKIRKIKRDVEFSFLQGVYQYPNDNLTARQTRGILNAITTNVVDAGTAAQLTKQNVDDLLRTMADNGAPFTNPVIMANSHNKQMVSNIYGYAPESRSMGGLNIQQIETDFAVLPVLYNRFMPTTVLSVTDLAYCQPVHLVVPGRGLFFTEPLAKTGSAERMHIYGEIGLEYGPEQWHGKIIDLAGAPA